MSQVSNSIIEKIGYVDGRKACEYILRGYCRKTLQKLRRHPAYPKDGYATPSGQKVLYKVDALLAFQKKLLKGEVKL